MTQLTNNARLKRLIVEHEKQSGLAPNVITRDAHRRTASKYRAALRSLELNERLSGGRQRELELA